MAYAAAGAATAFAGHNSAEADIHYSIAREAFPARHDKTVAFRLISPAILSNSKWIGVQAFKEALPFSTSLRRFQLRGEALAGCIFTIMFQS